MTENVEMIQLTHFVESTRTFLKRSWKEKRYVTSYLELVRLVKSNPKREAVLRWKGNRCAVFVSNNYGHIKAGGQE